MSVMDRFRLEDRVVVVTGAAGLVEATGRRAVTVATDVTDPDQCSAMVDTAILPGFFASEMTDHA